MSSYFITYLAILSAGIKCDLTEHQPQRNYRKYYAICGIGFGVLLSIFLICYIFFIKKWHLRFLPKHLVINLSLKHFCKGNDTETDCRICLIEFVHREKIQTLECGHYFHPKCIDTWLFQHRLSCPLCNKEVSISSSPLLSYCINLCSQACWFCPSKCLPNDDRRPLLESNLHTSSTMA